MLAAPDVRRLLLVSGSAGWGGAEKAMVDLANALAPGLEVTVLVPAGARYADRFSDAIREIRTLRPGSRRNPLALADLLGHVRAVAPDVVHTHAEKATEMVWWVSRVSPVRHLATKHNPRSRRIFSRVRWVSAVSEQVRASIDHPHGVTVVHNGIEPRPVEPRAKPEVFTVVAVGRLDRHKGFDRLVRATAELPFDLAVRIAGEGPERAALTELVRETGQQDRVRLLGHREDIPELLAGAHLQVVPSRSEGFSLALLEGLYYCDLVVSTRVGIAPEILPADFLVDGDAFAAKLAGLRERYDEAVARFRHVKDEHRERFLLSRTAERYLALYRRIVASDRA